MLKIKKLLPPSSRTVDQTPLIVLLQGPVGPFFREFALRLRGLGYQVLKVDFNAGDAWQSRGTGAFLFRDTLERWDVWFRAFLEVYHPKCVVLFGDQRNYHQRAIATCREFGVDAWCVEEGYIRPDYFTFEKGGNCASSAFLHMDDAIPTLPAITPIKGNGFRHMAQAATSYYLINNLLRKYVPNYIHHRNRPVLREAFFWLRNGFRKWRNSKKSAYTFLDLLECHNYKFFVVALQVYDDLNITKHGRGWSNETMIEVVIRSFAHNAMPDELLVIKCHPFDRGHRSYDGFIREMASISGVADRVRVVDDGPLGLLLRHARGMVNINSTSGILGLRVGCPVFVLGDAIYRRRELTQFGDTADLDAFWSEPRKPDPTEVERFTNQLIKDTQINGSLYQPEYFDIAMDAMIERMFAASTPKRDRDVGDSARPVDPIADGDRLR